MSTTPNTPKSLQHLQIHIRSPQLIGRDITAERLGVAFVAICPASNTLFIRDLYSSPLLRGINRVITVCALETDQTSRSLLFTRNELKL